MLVYLDSAPIIYLVENVHPYVDLLIQRLSVEGVVQVSSELSRLECRVKPLREGQTALLAGFEYYFNHIIAEMIPLSCYVIDLATELRARYLFKTPDAIHLACAISSRCEVFLTNDHRLDSCQEIPTEVIRVK